MLDSLTRSGPEAGGGGKVRVLVVESEGIVALDIRESLISSGLFEPTIALTGEEAVEAALRTNPRLLIVDLALRGNLSGLETAGRIRKHLDVPVVFLSTVLNGPARESMKSIGLSWHITKPFDISELHQAISAALNGYGDLFR
jgi:DNA-binding response OmpR family regulator